MPKPKPAFDEWGRYQGTPQQQGCVSRLMPFGVGLMLLGCVLVYLAGGNPGGLDYNVGYAASSHIASSSAYGSGANAVSAVFCFGAAGMFGAILLWGLSLKAKNGED